MGPSGIQRYDNGGRPGNAFAVREGTDDDVPYVAEMHSGQITEGFLPTLGRPFLRRLYHRVVRSPHAFLLVAEDAAKARIGFVAGATSTSRLYREFLVREGVIVAVTSGARLARSLPKVLETLHYGTVDGHTSESELLALAVDDAWRRRRVGTALVEAFLQRAAASGAVAARVVVGAGNAGALELYRRSGFDPVSDLEVHRGSTSCVMRANLSASQ